MKTFKPSDLSERDNYKFLIGSVIPRPVALVTSLSEEGVLNIAPFSYFNIASSDPPILSLAIQRQEGKSKDTGRNILRGKEAVIHIVSDHILKDANETAASLDQALSELDLTQFTLGDSKEVAVPGLQEARIRFEVDLYQHVPIEHEGETTADFFLLRILRYYIDETIYEDGKIDPAGLKAYSRLAGHDYAKIGEILTIPRPD